MALGNGTWIPESARDSRWWIFKKLFMCRVSNIQSMSVEYLQHHGMPSVGDSRHDTETANELVTRMLPISEMVKFFNDGVPVRVCNYADTKEIYERITDHLNFWKQNLENGLNTRGAPIDDLLLMDRFAMTVYEFAKHQFTTEIVDSIIARRMSSTLRVSRDRIMGRKPKTIEVTNPETGATHKEEEGLPARMSMSETFASRKAISGGAPKWK